MKFNEIAEKPSQKWTEEEETVTMKKKNIFRKIRNYGTGLKVIAVLFSIIIDSYSARTAFELVIRINVCRRKTFKLTSVKKYLSER